MSTQLASKRLSRVKLTERQWGCEIECIVPISRKEVASELRNVGVDAHSESYNHYTQDYWKVVTDASVLAPYGSGMYTMELVSPPLRGKEGLRQLGKVLELLNKNGAEVNNSCGLHVHHDVHEVQLDALKGVAKYYVLFEDEVSQFMTANRRRSGHNDYCRELKGHVFPNVNTAWKRIESWDTIDDVSYNWHDRQTVLNMQPAYNRGTIEFRHHDATLDYPEIAYWIAFTQSILEASVKGSLKLSKGLKPNVHKMFRLAGVQPVVRWHFLEQKKRYEDVAVEPWVEGSENYSSDIDYDDEGYEDEEYETFEPTWVSDELGRDEYVVEQGENGSYFPQCECPSCRHARGEI